MFVCGLLSSGWPFKAGYIQMRDHVLGELLLMGICEMHSGGNNLIEIYLLTFSSLLLCITNGGRETAECFRKGALIWIPIVLLLSKRI